MSWDLFNPEALHFCSTASESNSSASSHSTDSDGLWRLNGLPENILFPLKT